MVELGEAAAIVDGGLIGPRGGKAVKPRGRSLGWVLPLPAWLLVAALGLNVSVFPGWDQMNQIWSVAAFEAGDSPAPNMIPQVPLHDVEFGGSRWIWHWPPGVPILLAALESSGLSRAAACRLLGMTASLVGVLGWARWLLFFPLRRSVQRCVLVLLPLLPWAWSGVLGFGSDVFSFAVTPLLLVSALRMSETGARGSDRLAAALALGAATSFGYGLKYSIALTAAGAFLFLAFEFLRSRSRILLALALGAGLVASVGPILVSSLNLRYSGAVSVLNYGRLDGIKLDEFLAVLGNLPFALFDSAPIWHFAFPGTRHGLFDYSRWATPAMALAGVPGTAYCVVLMRRVLLPRRLRRILVALWVTFVAAFLWMYRGQSPWTEVRHFLPLGLALLPAILAALEQWWKANCSLGRRAIAVAFVGIYAAPAVPGAIVLLARAATEQSDLSRVEEGSFNPYLSAENARRLRQEFSRRCRSSSCRWLVPEPWSGVQLSTKFALVSFEYTDAAVLSSLDYDENPQVDVWALQFKRGELGERCRIFRESWRGQGTWERLEFEDPLYEVWILRSRIRERDRGCDPERRERVAETVGRGRALEF